MSTLKIILLSMLLGVSYAVAEETWTRFHLDNGEYVSDWVIVADSKYIGVRTKDHPSETWVKNGAGKSVGIGMTCVRCDGADFGFKKSTASFSNAPWALEYDTKTFTQK